MLLLDIASQGGIKLLLHIASQSGITLLLEIVCVTSWDNVNARHSLRHEMG